MAAAALSTVRMVGADKSRAVSCIVVRFDSGAGTGVVSGSLSWAAVAVLSLLSDSKDVLPVVAVFTVPPVPLVGFDDFPLEVVLLLLNELPLEVEETTCSGGQAERGSLAAFSKDSRDGLDLDLNRWMTVTEAPKGLLRKGIDSFLKRRRGSGDLSVGEGAGHVAGSLTEFPDTIAR